jgi:hypothetical protein
MNDEYIAKAVEGSKQLPRGLNHFPFAITLLLITYSSSFIAHHSAQAQSFLRSGTWVRIGVTQTGPYRLTYDALTKLSPDFANADPRRFRVYGNGGTPLPQPNANPRPTDLTENAILVDGEADGRFDRADAVLFWGESPHAIRQDSATGRLSHTINPYCDTTYYFLTIGTDPGRRMATRAPGAGTSLSAVSAFSHYAFRETDQTSRVRSGREWLGEFFGVTTEQTFLFDTPGLVANAPVLLTSSVVGYATVATQFGIKLNGQALGNQPIKEVSGYRYDHQGIENRQTFTATPTGSETTLRVTLTFDKNGQSSASGWLNFLGVQTLRDLRPYAEPTVAWLSPGRYTLRQATPDLRVWNISSPTQPVSQSLTIAGSEGTWTNVGRGAYALFTDAQFKQPASLETVTNQNIRTEDTPNLLIITPPTFRAEAERLANFRRNNDGLTVLVLTTRQIYNEFASGQPDPTAIRDAARHFARKTPNTLRYLLLFGDATFDYRNLTGAQSPAQQANMVPVYESRESLHPVFSYSSDDYFGFLKDADGEWVETFTGDLRMDIGVGRLPVKNTDEARTVVDKLVRYASDRTLIGDWQTRLTFVADDGDANIHQKDADELAREVESGTAFRPQRLFTDDFPQVSSPSGQRAPGVNQAITQAMNEGRLIINYAGHGGVSGWSEEQILTLADIFSWRNRRLPLFVTATCEFGRYDDPDVNSGAELSLFSRQGGAIGLLTTTRPVYANTNFLLNEAFYRAVFKPVNGQMPRLGDVMRDTKNNSLQGSLNRNFALLGDPSMRLAYPQAEVAVTRLSGRTVQANRPDTLRALQTVVLEGEIRNPATGQPLTDFSGQVRLTLFDKATARTTRGTESNPMTYYTLNSSLFSGQATVTKGQFRVQFTIPKDIDYQLGKGTLYAYAVRTDSLLTAVGQYANLIIGGSDSQATADTQPPALTLSVVGATLDPDGKPRVAGPDVTLRMDLSDNLGINLSRTGLGHELTAQLGNNVPLILNDNYVATGENGRQGLAAFTLTGLKPGTYTIRAKAWDVNNNSTEGALTFIVSEKPVLTLSAVRAYPNPMAGQTTFQLVHNRPGDALNWTVRFFDSTGRLLNEQAGQCDQCSETVSLGEWNGLGQRGNPLPNGMYVYRVEMQAISDGSTAQASERILIVR